MARPRKHRCCRRDTADCIYKPQGVAMGLIGTTLLGADQFEAMRLCDVDDLDQQTAGERMGVSRGTVQRLLKSGRKRVVEAILRGDAIVLNLKESETSDAGLHTD